MSFDVDLYEDDMLSSYEQAIADEQMMRECWFYGTIHAVAELILEHGEDKIMSLIRESIDRTINEQEKAFQ